MSPQNSPTKTNIATPLTLVSILIGALLLQGASADHQPANKGGAAASDIVFQNASLVNGFSSNETELLTSSLKTSHGTDLLLSVSLECALWTDVSITGNDDQTAAATVSVWIEIDGEPVSVVDGSPATSAEDAEVVFCNRLYRMQTLNVDDEDQQIDTYIRTRAAHAFNWVALDLGSGVHDVVVKSRIDAQATSGASVKAGVGTRTLVIEPTKFANDLVLS